MINFRFTLLSIFIILLAFVIFVGGLAPYYLLYIFLLALIIPLLHSLITIMKIEGKITIPDGALYAGDEIEIGYGIENKSRFSIPYIEVEADIINMLTGKDIVSNVLSLRPKSAFSKKNTITLNKRGYYQLGEINVIIRDVFGFYSFQKTIKSYASLLVYPKIVDLYSLKITANYRSGDLLTTNSIFQDKSDISSLREYHQGDPIKTIHWKLTAKKDQVIVKDFENRVETNTIIFLESYKGLYKDDINRRLEDKAVDIALSIINYCLNNSIEVILESQNEGRYVKIMGEEKSDLKPYLDELTRFNGNGAYKIDSLITSQMDIIKKGSTVIVISPSLNRSMGAVGIELRAKNLNPIFITVTDRLNNTGYINSAIEKRLIQEQIPVYTIDYNEDLKEVLEVANG